LNKLLEITKAWIIASNPTPEQKEIALYRSEVCDGCEMKELVKHLNIYICRECGCPFSKKIYSPVNSCPLQKWKI
jgi:ribosomal protein L37AE/L43A